MYSALKQDGQRLYDLARSGREANVPAREVTVYALDLTGLTREHGALLRVRCSRGFYVRTLCHDLGETLGCPAHMRFLLRIRSGPFGLDTAFTLETLAEKAAQGTLAGCLLPPETGLGAMAMAQVPPDLEKAVRNGGPRPMESLCRTGRKRGAAFWTAAGGGAAGRGAATGRRGQGENLACGMSK